MHRVIIAAILGVIFVAPDVVTAAPNKPPPSRSVVGTFQAGSGLYLLSVNGTDGIRQVNGRVRATQKTPSSLIRLSVNASRLAPRTQHVAVLYKDGICTPTPGVTAFPSASFRTNSRGRVDVRNLTVNPRAINPAGFLLVQDVRSISIRQVVAGPSRLQVFPVVSPPLLPVPTVSPLLAPNVPGPSLPTPNVPTVPVPTPTPLPTVPPTVPNLAAVEACDRTVQVR